MIGYIEKQRRTFFYRALSVFIAVSFLLGSVLPPQMSYAQMLPQTFLSLPAPGSIVSVTPGVNPPLIKGMTIHPDNPFLFDFIIHPGDEELEGEALREESNKMIKYFLAALTTPEEEMWVNLSPYEKDRIVPQAFGQTEMGRDLLAQDYMLKQLAASLLYPEDELGRAFWKRVRKKAYEQFGTTDIPMNSYNKIWIVPEKAVIYEHGTTAVVVESHLKVMLDRDYYALQHVTRDEGRRATDDSSLVFHPSFIGSPGVASDIIRDIIIPAPEPTMDKSGKGSGTGNITNQIIKEIILPEIEREVNEGETFANLRQITNAVILASWYKENVQGSILEQFYIDQGKTKGIDSGDKEINQKIYDQYLEAFKKGVYDFIKEEYDPATKDIIPRKYFSGGLDYAKVTDNTEKTANPFGADQAMRGAFNVTTQLVSEKISINSDLAMTIKGIEIENGPLFNFYLGERPDHRGRNIDDIWQYDFKKLESEHDFIQLLFPDDRLGMFFAFNLFGLEKEKMVIPIILDKDKKVLEGDSELVKVMRARLLKSFRRMLRFYGFKYSFDDRNNIKIVRAKNYESRSQNWLTPEDHNFLRITRILKSLHLFNLDIYAQLFFEALQGVYEENKRLIDYSRSFEYWEGAVKGIKTKGRLTYEHYLRDHRVEGADFAMSAPGQEGLEKGETEERVPDATTADSLTENAGDEKPRRSYKRFNQKEAVTYIVDYIHKDHQFPSRAHLAGALGVSENILIRRREGLFAVLKEVEDAEVQTLLLEAEKKWKPIRKERKDFSLHEAATKAVDHIKREGVAPTVRELAEPLGITAQAVANHLHEILSALEDYEEEDEDVAEDINQAALYKRWQLLIKALRSKQVKKFAFTEQTAESKLKELKPGTRIYLVLSRGRIDDPIEDVITVENGFSFHMKPEEMGRSVLYLIEGREELAVLSVQGKIDGVSAVIEEKASNPTSTARTASMDTPATDAAMAAIAPAMSAQAREGIVADAARLSAEASGVTPVKAEEKTDRAMGVTFRLKEVEEGDSEMFIDIFGQDEAEKIFSFFSRFDSLSMLDQKAHYQREIIEKSDGKQVRQHQLVFTPQGEPTQLVSFYSKKHFSPDEYLITQAAYEEDIGPKVMVSRERASGEEVLLTQSLRGQLNRRQHLNSNFILKEASAIGYSLGRLHAKGYTHDNLVVEQNDEKKLLLWHIYLAQEENELKARFIDYGNARAAKTGQEFTKEADEVIAYLLKDIGHYRKGESRFDPQEEELLNRAVERSFREAYESGKNRGQRVKSKEPDAAMAAGVQSRKSQLLSHTADGSELRADQAVLSDALIDTMFQFIPHADEEQLLTFTQWIEQDYEQMRNFPAFITDLTIEANLELQKQQQVRIDKIQRLLSNIHQAVRSKRGLHDQAQVTDKAMAAPAREQSDPAPNPPKRNKRFDLTEVVAYIKQYIINNNKFPSENFIADQLGVYQGTVSRNIDKILSVLEEDPDEVIQEFSLIKRLKFLKRLLRNKRYNIRSYSKPRLPGLFKTQKAGTRTYYILNGEIIDIFAATETTKPGVQDMYQDAVLYLNDHYPRIEVLSLDGPLDLGQGAAARQSIIPTSGSLNVLQLRKITVFIVDYIRRFDEFPSAYKFPAEFKMTDAKLSRHLDQILTALERERGPDVDQVVQERRWKMLRTKLRQTKGRKVSVKGQGINDFLGEMWPGKRIYILEGEDDLDVMVVQKKFQLNIPPDRLERAVLYVFEGDNDYVVLSMMGEVEGAQAIEGVVQGSGIIEVTYNRSADQVLRSSPSSGASDKAVTSEEPEMIKTAEEAFRAGRLLSQAYKKVRIIPWHRAPAAIKILKNHLEVYSEKHDMEGHVLWDKQTVLSFNSARFFDTDEDPVEILDGFGIYLLDEQSLIFKTPKGGNFIIERTKEGANPKKHVFRIRILVEDETSRVSAQSRAAKDGRAGDAAMAAGMAPQADEEGLGDIVRLINDIDSGTGVVELFNALPIIEEAKKIDPAFNQVFDDDTWFPANRAGLYFLLDLLNFQIFIPRGQVIQYIPYPDRPSLVQMKINRQAWQKLPYLNSHIWVNAFTAPFGDVAFGGIGHGWFVFIDQTGVRQNGKILYERYMNDRTDDLYQFMKRAAQLMRDLQVSEEDFLEKVLIEFVRQRLTKRAQDIAFAAQKLKRDIRKEPNSLDLVSRVIFKNGPSFGIEFDLGYFTDDPEEQEKIASLMQAALKEAAHVYSSYLGGIIGHMKQLMAQKEFGLALVAFFRFMDEMAIVQLDKHTPISQNALLRIAMAIQLQQDLKTADYDPDGISFSRLVSGMNNNNLEYTANMISALLENIYAKHYLTDEERLDALSPPYYTLSGPTDAGFSDLAMAANFPELFLLSAQDGKGAVAEEYYTFLSQEFDSKAAAVLAFAATRYSDLVSDKTLGGIKDKFTSNSDRYHNDYLAVLLAILSARMANDQELAGWVQNNIDASPYLSVRLMATLDKLDQLEGSSEHVWRQASPVLKKIFRLFTIVAINQVEFEEGLKELRETNPSLTVEIINEWHLAQQGSERPESFFDRMKEIDPDTIVLRTHPVLSQEQLARNVFDVHNVPSLKHIIQAGVGTDHVHKEYATANGIQVINEPTGNNPHVAYWTWRHLTAALRQEEDESGELVSVSDNIFQVEDHYYHKADEKRKLKEKDEEKIYFETKNPEILAFREKLQSDLRKLLTPVMKEQFQRMGELTIGILGLGNIGGQAVPFEYRKLEEEFGLKLRIVGYDKLIKMDDDRLTEKERYRKERLLKLPNDPKRRVGLLATEEELFQQADVVSVHIPNDPENYRFINEDLLSDSKVKILINTSRRDIVNYESIRKKLAEDPEFHYATDLVSSEYIDVMNHPRTIVSYHLAGFVAAAEPYVWADVGKINTTLIKRWLGTTSNDDHPVNIENAIPSDGRWRADAAMTARKPLDKWPTPNERKNFDLDEVLTHAIKKIRDVGAVPAARDLVTDLKLNRQTVYNHMPELLAALEDYDDEDVQLAAFNIRWEQFQKSLHNIKVKKLLFTGPQVQKKLKTLEPGTRVYYILLNGDGDYPIDDVMIVEKDFQLGIPGRNKDNAVLYLIEGQEKLAVLSIDGEIDWVRAAVLPEALVEEGQTADAAMAADALTLEEKPKLVTTTQQAFQAGTILTRLFRHLSVVPNLQLSQEMKELKRLLRADTDSFGMEGDILWDGEIFLSFHLRNITRETEKAVTFPQGFRLYTFDEKDALILHTPDGSFVIQQAHQANKPRDHRFRVEKAPGVDAAMASYREKIIGRELAYLPEEAKKKRLEFFVSAKEIDLMLTGLDLLQRYWVEKARESHPETLEKFWAGIRLAATRRKIRKVIDEKLEKGELQVLGRKEEQVVDFLRKMPSPELARLLQKLWSVSQNSAEVFARGISAYFHKYPGAHSLVGIYDGVRGLNNQRHFNDLIRHALENIDASKAGAGSHFAKDAAMTAGETAARGHTGEPEKKFNALDTPFVIVLTKQGMLIDGRSPRSDILLGADHDLIHMAVDLHAHSYVLDSIILASFSNGEIYYTELDKQGREESLVNYVDKYIELESQNFQEAGSYFQNTIAPFLERGTTLKWSEDTFYKIVETVKNFREQLASENKIEKPHKVETKLEPEEMELLDRAMTSSRARNQVTKELSDLSRKRKLKYLEFFENADEIDLLLAGLNQNQRSQVEKAQQSPAFNTLEEFWVKLGTAPTRKKIRAVIDESFQKGQLETMTLGQEEKIISFLTRINPPEISSILQGLSRIEESDADSFAEGLYLYLNGNQNPDSLMQIHYRVRGFSDEGRFSRLVRYFLENINTFEAGITSGYAMDAAMAADQEPTLDQNFKILFLSKLDEQYHPLVNGNYLKMAEFIYKKGLDFNVFVGGDKKSLQIVPGKRLKAGDRAMTAIYENQVLSAVRVNNAPLRELPISYIVKFYPYLIEMAEDEKQTPEDRIEIIEVISDIKKEVIDGAETEAAGDIEKLNSVGDDLIGMLDEAFPQLKHTIVRALVKINDEKAIGPVRKLVFHEESRIREIAAWALGELRASEAADDLIWLIENPNDQQRGKDAGRVRKTAIIALEKVSREKTVEAADVLLSILNDPYMPAGARGAALVVLAKIGDHRVLWQAKRFLKQHAGYRRQDAADALGYLFAGKGESGAEGIEEAVDDLIWSLDDPIGAASRSGVVDSVIKSSLRALAKIGHRRAINPIRRVLWEGNKYTRPVAAEALGIMEAWEAVDDLMQAAENPGSHPYLRETARKALIEIRINSGEGGSDTAMMSDVSMKIQNALLQTGNSVVWEQRAFNATLASLGITGAKLNDLKTALIRELELHSHAAFDLYETDTKTSLLSRAMRLSVYSQLITLMQGYHIDDDLKDITVKRAAQEITEGDVEELLKLVGFYFDVPLASDELKEEATLGDVMFLILGKLPGYAITAEEARVILSWYKFDAYFLTALKPGLESVEKNEPQYHRRKVQLYFSFEDRRIILNEGKKSITYQRLSLAGLPELAAKARELLNEDILQKYNYQPLAAAQEKIAEFAQRIGVADAAMAAAKQGKPKILIVEEDRSMEELMSVSFEGSGIDVLTAANPQDALSLIQSGSGQIDAVFFELREEENPGMSLVEMLAERGLQIPVIVNRGNFFPIDPGLQQRLKKHMGRVVLVIETHASIADQVEKVQAYFQSLGKVEPASDKVLSADKSDRAMLGSAQIEQIQQEIPAADEVQLRRLADLLEEEIKIISQKSELLFARFRQTDSGEIENHMRHSEKITELSHAVRQKLKRLQSSGKQTIDTGMTAPEADWREHLRSKLANRVREKHYREDVDKVIRMIQRAQTDPDFKLLVEHGAGYGKKAEEIAQNRKDIGMIALDSDHLLAHIGQKNLSLYSEDNFVYFTYRFDDFLKLLPDGVVDYVLLAKPFDGTLSSLNYLAPLIRQKAAPRSTIILNPYDQTQVDRYHKGNSFQEKEEPQFRFSLKQDLPVNTIFDVHLDSDTIYQTFFDKIYTAPVHVQEDRAMAAPERKATEQGIVNWIEALRAMPIWFGRSRLEPYVRFMIETLGMPQERDLIEATIDPLRPITIEENIRYEYPMPADLNEWFISNIIRGHTQSLATLMDLVRREGQRAIERQTRFLELSIPFSTLEQKLSEDSFDQVGALYANKEEEFSLMYLVGMPFTAMALDKMGATISARNSVDEDGRDEVEFEIRFPVNIAVETEELVDAAMVGGDQDKSNIFHVGDRVLISNGKGTIKEKLSIHPKYGQKLKIKLDDGNEVILYSEVSQILIDVDKKKDIVLDQIGEFLEYKPSLKDRYMESGKHFEESEEIEDKKAGLLLDGVPLKLIGEGDNSTLFEYKDYAIRVIQTKEGKHFPSESQLDLDNYLFEAGIGVKAFAVGETQNGYSYIIGQRIHGVALNEILLTINQKQIKQVLNLMDLMLAEGVENGNFYPTSVMLEKESQRAILVDTKGSSLISANRTRLAWFYQSIYSANEWMLPQLLTHLDKILIDEILDEMEDGQEFDANDVIERIKRGPMMPHVVFEDEVISFLERVLLIEDGMIERIDAGRWVKHDRAMTTNPGGIDMNPQNIKVEKRGPGVKIQFPVFTPDFQVQFIEGLVPVIIQIAPVANIPLLLGIIDQKNEPDSLQFSSLDPFEEKERLVLDKPEQLSLLN